MRREVEGKVRRGVRIIARFVLDLGVTYWGLCKCFACELFVRALSSAWLSSP